MAPGQPKRKRPEDVVWFFGMFWPHYSNQNGPSVKEAYRSFKRDWYETYSDQPAMLMALPSYDAVIRLVDKLPLRERMRGRVSGSAAKAFEVYQQRDWSQMPVNGCWISDGKSLNLKVAHPIHGRPFTPELTLVIDGRTRYIVGWSVSLAENAIAVADAYRHGMKHYGKPLFVYSDNGGGETNKMLDADITGIFPRLHIEHMTGIPGNPQARGIIERLNGVMPDRLAKRFLTYNGIGADPNAVRIRGQQMLSLSNALRDGRELTAQNKKTLKILPTWRQLIDAVQEEIDDYNNHHGHSELPKVNGKWMSPAAYRQWVLEQEGDDIEYMTDGELREMFMPEVKRVAQRGWIALENNQYFSKELITVDRQEVRVAFDIHDPTEVIVRQMDDTYVCTAIWNGNTASPVPVARVQKTLEERAKRKIKLAETKIQDAEDELRPALEHKADTDFSKFIPMESKPDRISSRPYLFESEYEDDLKKYGNYR
ncbi:transposase [Serratia symbiotica]|uniref:Transposase n=2 Tax=Serratia symbiotica TaxID=138074 RepID=A0A7D5NTI4_9GAMM|nr:transposase [Serratia symbiotica]